MFNKYLVGSKLLGLENNHDTDYIIVVQSKDDIKKEELGKGDFHIHEEDELYKLLNFELSPTIFHNLWNYMVSYQLDQDIIGQNFPYKYHVLENKINYIRLLKYVRDNHIFNFYKDENLNKGNCSKLIYHIAYLIFILENNSPQITEEQKEIIQKIHDLKMPQDYIEVLKLKLEKLESTI